MENLCSVDEFMKLVNELMKTEAVRNLSNQLTLFRIKKEKKKYAYDSGNHDDGMLAFWTAVFILKVKKLNKIELLLEE